MLEPEPSPDLTGLRGQPGITGELRAHALELVKKDKDLEEYMHRFEEINRLDDLLSIFDGQYRLNFAWAHVFHTLRIAFKDTNPTNEKDWFKPFVAVLVAWHEHHFRHALGMPHSLPGTASEADIASLALSGFVECVNGDARYPDCKRLANSPS